MAVAKFALRDIDFDTNGLLNAGGLLHTYAASTSTPQSTYTDATGGTANSNPIEWDASGLAHIWLTEGVSYKFVFCTPDDVPIYTENAVGIPAADAAAGAVNLSVVCSFNGTPAATQWLAGAAFAEAVNFLGNWNGSQGDPPKTLPTATFNVDIQKNGVSVGTATCDTAGLWTFTTPAGAAVTLAIGDTLDFYGPASPDATIADFSFTLLGTLG